MNEIDDSFKTAAIAGLADTGDQTDPAPAAAALSEANSPVATETLLDDLVLDPDLLTATPDGSVEPNADVALDPVSHTAILVATTLVALDTALAGAEGDLAPEVTGPELGLSEAPTQDLAAAEDLTAVCDMPTVDTGRIADPALGWRDLAILPGDGDLPIVEIDPLPREWRPSPEVIASDSDGDGVVDTWTTPGSVIASDWDGDGMNEVQTTTADYVEQDRNGDGIIDAIWTGGESTEYDSDGDGDIDTWFNFYGWSQQDTDFDGVFETWTDGTSVTETDTDDDGRVDTQSTEGVWFANDTNGDGASDSWGYTGTVTESDTDADGAFDQRVTSGGYREDDLDGDGSADRITWAGDVTETDTDGDGVYDSIVTGDDLGSYDYGTIVLDDPITLDPIDPVTGGEGEPDPIVCGFDFVVFSDVMPIDDVFVIDTGLGDPSAGDVAPTLGDGEPMICICWLAPDSDTLMLA